VRQRIGHPPQDRLPRGEIDLSCVTRNATHVVVEGLGSATFTAKPCSILSEETQSARNVRGHIAGCLATAPCDFQGRLLSM